MAKTQIPAGYIAANAITATEIATNSITAAAIASDAIVVADIADNSITSAKIAADAVGSSEIATLTDHLRFSDDVKATFGASNDLQIYHVGDSSSYIATYSGNLIIQSTLDNQDVLIKSDDGSGGLANYIQADGSTGEVRLYHYGTEKFNTLSTGVEVTGNITVSGTVDGRDLATDGTKLDGIEASADVTDTANVTSAGALMDSEITNLAQVKAFDSSDYATAAQGSTADSALQNLSEDTTPQLGGDLGANGNLITFGDSSGATDDRLKFGASGDLQIYHDGSDSYVRENGTGNLNIQGNNLILEDPNGVNFLGGNGTTGAVTVYYSGAAKLATTSTGIDVTGNIVVSGTVDGRDLATDGTKLDGIESGATADQTQAEINALGITATGLSGTPNITVGTISSGDITTSGEIFLNNAKEINFKKADGTNDGTKIERYSGNALRFRYGGNQAIFDALEDHTFSVRNSTDTDVFRVIPNATAGSTTVDVVYGSFRMGSTTVIDSSRNLTNIGTISSGAITSTGNITLAEYLYHSGNTGTNLRFQTDRATLTSGGGASVDAHSNGNLYLTGTTVQVYGNYNSTGTISSGAITSTGAIEGASFSDGTISGITFIDEDSFATNSATRVPTQQSIKAYVDAQVAGVVDSAPSALNTLNELAAALGDDANFSTTTSTALGNRLRVDTASQGLTGTQQANAITNLGITATKAELNVLDGITATVTELNYTDGVTSNIQTQLDGKQASGSYLTGNQTITLSGDVSGSGTTSIAVTIADDSHNHIISNVDGLADAFDNSYITKESAADLAIGWYTIATNNGSRATARFGIWDDDSGDHQSVTFYAAHHYGNDTSNTLTVLDNSYYSGTPLRYIRIKDAGTYDGAALQVYIDKADNNVNVAILGDNFQGSGWVLQDWVPDATTPSGVSNYGNFAERAKVDLDNIAQGGFATTGEIYAGGDTTQYRVFHDSYHPNADTLTTARTISLTGAVTGSTSFDGSGNVSIATTATADPTLTLSGDASGSATFTNLGNATLSVTVADDSHNHVISNVDGLQTALDAKMPYTGGTFTGAVTIQQSGTPTFTLYDNGNAGGGGASAKILFSNTGGNAMGIGYTADSTADSDMIISTNAAGTYGGYLGLASGAITDSTADIILEPKGSVRIAAGDLQMGTTQVITSAGNWVGGGNISEFTNDSGYLTSFDITTQTDSKYVRSDTADTMSGRLTASGGIDGLTLANGISGNNFNITGVNQISINDPGEGIAFTGTTTVTLYAIDDATDSIMNFSNASELRRNNNKVWDAGNDGSGSGLDADTVDGIQASAFLRSNAADTATGQLFFDAGFDSHPIMLSGAQNFDNIDRSGFYNLYNTQTSSTNSPPFDYGTMIAIGNDKGSAGFGLQIAHERLGTGMYVRGMNDTASAWSSWAEIWTSTTDGAGSGLDADTLDGIQAASFAQLSGATFTGEVNINARLDIGAPGNDHEIRIYKSDNNVSDHIQFYNGTTRVGEIGCQDTTWLRINQVTAKNIYTPRYIRADAGFFVDGTAKGINGSGNFIGGTIAGASDYGTLLRANANDTATGIITFSNSTASTSKTTGAVIVTGGVGISGALNVGGDVTAFASSDERLKDNLTQIENPIEKINQIGGYEFDWNDKQNLHKGHDIGVVAQEIEKVLPEIVTDRDDGYKAVKYEKLVALLIEGMKEQQKQIEELKERLDK